MLLYYDEYGEIREGEKSIKNTIPLDYRMLFLSFERKRDKKRGNPV